MKYKPKIAGFYQAIGLVAYVSIFGTVINALANHPFNITPSPAFSVMIFLTTFMISALICGLIALAYPATLFFAGNKPEALKTIFWTLGWLCLFFVAILITFIVVSNGPGLNLPR